MILVASLWIAAFAFARWYLPAYRSGGGVAQFYQDQFGPAVMLACGRGFVNVDSPHVPAFDDFLKQRKAALRCDEVPPTISQVALTGFQGSSRYLMGAAAAVWRFTGIDFRALDVVIAAMFAIAVAAAYAAIRLGCGRSVALMIVLLWTLSYRHLNNLPHLRDYSKAPFFMLMLVAMGLVSVERRPRRLLAIGALFGLAQGLGFGMRTDVMLNFVPFVLVLCAVAAVDGWKTLRSGAACLAASILAFAIVAFPILQTYARQASLWHVVLLGFTAPYDENLNIGFPRPAYSFPYAYNDSYIETTVRAYWHRLHPAEPMLTMLTPPYDRACRDYCLRLARTFPGDMVTRGLSSVIGIANLPFSPSDGYVPIGMSQARLEGWWQIRGHAAETMQGAGLPLVAAALSVVGVESLFYAFVGVALLFFWGAFPALEFHGRHIFHFELVVLASLGWTAAIVARLLAARPPTLARRASGAAAAVVVCAVVVAGFVLAARAYQVPNARALVQSYDRAAAAPLVVASTPVAGDRVRLGVGVFERPSARDQVQEALLRAEFDFAACGHPPVVNASFRYAVSEPWFNAFTREVPLDDLGAAPTRVFVPVYSVVRNWIEVARFAGVEVPTTFARCVRLARIDNAYADPLWLSVTMAPDWQRKLYERVRLGSGLGY